MSNPFDQFDEPEAAASGTPSNPFDAFDGPIEFTADEQRQIDTGVATVEEMTAHRRKVDGMAARGEIAPRDTPAPAAPEGHSISARDVTMGERLESAKTGFSYGLKNMIPGTYSAAAAISNAVDEAQVHDQYKEGSVTAEEARAPDRAEMKEALELDPVSSRVGQGTAFATTIGGKAWQWGATASTPVVRKLGTRFGPQGATAAARLSRYAGRTGVMALAGLSEAALFGFVQEGDNQANLEDRETKLIDRIQSAAREGTSPENALALPLISIAYRAIRAGASKATGGSGNFTPSDVAKRLRSIQGTPETAHSAKSASRDIILEATRDALGTTPGEARKLVRALKNFGVSGDAVPARLPRVFERVDSGSEAGILPVRVIDAIAEEFSTEAPNLAYDLADQLRGIAGVSRKIENEVTQS
ncbi:MAG: hypothetical protein AAF317_20655, partial [Pseudomonadota bacterium]